MDACHPVAGSAPDDATCYGLDSDCDGTTDEDYIPTATTCGVGEYSGNTCQLECQAGAEVNTCDPLFGAGPDDATCDGLDNDCDGTADEDHSPIHI